jgi:SAM-dependent methyltransferase
MTSKETKSTSYALKDPEVRRTETARLKLQAEVLSQLESKVHSEHGITDPQTILDIGCGTGAYLSTLSGRYPKAQLFGIDHNPTFLEAARTAIASAKFFEGDILDEKQLTKRINQLQPQLIILRFVLQHLTPLGSERLLKTIRSSSPKNSILLIQEPDDSKIEVHPENRDISKLIERAISLQARRGGNRTIGGVLKSQLKSYGFTHINETVANFGSESIGLKNCERIYLPILKSGLDLTDQTAEASNQYRRAETWFSESNANKSFIYPMHILSAHNV